MLAVDPLKKIDREIAKYPPDKKQSAVMSALIVAQDEMGWLSSEVMDFVARYLGMPPVAVYEVATFYAMYNLEPVGTYKLTLCTNLPCGLRGARRLPGPEKDSLGKDQARRHHRRAEEVRAARARRRRLSDRAEMVVHAAPGPRPQVRGVQFRRRRAWHLQGSRPAAL